jgi:DNA-directed RNA polymerase sigma subunit (sigma70/sigma32)
MTTQGVWAVLRSSEWQALEQCNRHVAFLGKFAENDAKAKLSTNDIGKMFNIRSGNIRQIRHKADRKRENPHRSFTLDLEQKANVVRFTDKRFKCVAS